MRRKRGQPVVKKRTTISIGVMLLLFMSGCGNSQQATKASKSAKKSSISVVRVKSKVFTDKTSKTSETKHATSTSASASTRSSVKSDSARSQPRVNTTMNLSEIRQGFYGSLLGEWKEVATSVNKHNGKGNVWEGPRSDAKLTVTDTKISDGEMALVRGQFEDPRGDQETYNTNAGRQEHGALSIDGDIGAAAVTYCFYPKGVALSGWGDKVPTTIKTDTERIITRTSNNSYVKVFERQTTATDAGHLKSTMALNRIKTGDYSSLNGTWQNGQGNQIKVHNQQMKFSDFGLMHRATPGTITKLKMDVPSLDDSKGSPKLVDGLKYHQQLTLKTEQGVCMLGSYFSVSGSSGGLYDVVFMPAGENADLNNGDGSRDRIAAFATQNEPKNVSNNKIYYRVN